MATMFLNLIVLCGFLFIIVDARLGFAGTMTEEKLIKNKNEHLKHDGGEELKSAKMERMMKLIEELHKLSQDLVESEAGHQEGQYVWGNWSPWTSCSVTCGRGREIRWRKRGIDRKRKVCRECEDEQGDYEMEERMCQLTECSGWEKTIEAIPDLVG